MRTNHLRRPQTAERPGAAELEPRFAFLSIDADFDISDVVDRSMEVHALIPKEAFGK